ncbi:FAD-dependent oxidoreductase [Moorena sp. SIO4G3]|uniref:FAD-dependent oxidoreductase n=1 Tax=Moorena sp. SIO4G3 TaxID=2607821 RepID=UPI0025F2F856|nr:FAD-dependent oxidoreductase [Moorena sp. SIO4G3]
MVLRDYVFKTILFPLLYAIYVSCFYIFSAVQLLLLVSLLPILTLLSQRQIKEKQQEHTLHVAIIGAGVRGLCSAVWLKRQGVEVTIFESGDDIGGTWSTFAYDSSTLQMPSIAYTFHHSNQWPQPRASAGDIVKNLRHMCEKEELTNRIRLGERVESIFRDKNRKFSINHHAGEQFDGVLICTGHLCERMDMMYPGIETFAGEVVYPYEYEPSQIHRPGSKTLIVGGGASAMEHIKYGLDSGCQAIYWAVRRPKILQVDDVKRSLPLQDLIEFSPMWMTLIPQLIQWIEWPFLYRPIYAAHNMDNLFPSIWERPAIPQFNIYQEIQQGRVVPIRGKITGLRNHTVEITTAEGCQTLEADTIVSCTGFRYKIPSFFQEQYQDDGTMLLADCPANVTFTSYGLGNSTMHAKLLYMHLVDPNTRPKVEENCGPNLLVPRNCWQKDKERLLHLSFYFVRYLISQRSRFKWLVFFLSQSYPSLSKVSCIPRISRLWAPVFAPFGL